MSTGDYSVQIPCQPHNINQHDADSGDAHSQHGDSGQGSCYDPTGTESVGHLSELSAGSTNNPFETARSELTLTQTSYCDTNLSGLSMVPGVQLSDVSTVLASSAVNPVVAHVNIEEIRREKLFSYYHNADQPNWNFSLDNPPFPGVRFNDESSPHKPFFSDDDNDDHLTREENGNNIAYTQRPVVDENASNAEAEGVQSAGPGDESRKSSAAGDRTMSVMFGVQKKSARKRKKSMKTYQMGPYDGEEFDWCKGKRIVDRVLTVLLPNMAEYEAVAAAHLVKGITTQVMVKLKKLTQPRFRYICHVTLVQATGQSIHVVSRQLWHPDTDKVVCVTRQCQGYVVVVTLHGIYKE